MTIEDALALIDTTLDPLHFKNLHQDIFCLSWEGKSYQEIAETCGYDTDYVRHVGYQLWQNLSQALEQKVTKRNLQVVFRRLEQQNQVSSTGDYPSSNEVGAVPQLLPTPQPAKSNSNGYHPPMELISDQTACSLISDLSNHLSTNNGVYCIGRKSEQNMLMQWLTGQGIEQTYLVSLISLLGMAGIGKSYLVNEINRQMPKRFQRVIWRSLRNAPSFTATFANLIDADQQDPDQWPTHIDAQIERLMDYFRQHRCLLILDNFETILQPGQMGGHYQPDHQAYGQLLRHLMDSPHQSCVLLTSREQPIGINLRNPPTVQTLYLQGLSSSETHALLKQQGIDATPTDVLVLHEYYGGNPFALKVAASNISSLFRGKLSAWMKQSNFVFGAIQQLLEQQFQKLSPPEQQIIDTIASHTGDISIDQLHEALVVPGLMFTTDLLPALQSLQNRSLLRQQEDRLQLLPYLSDYTLRRHQSRTCVKNKVTHRTRLKMGISKDRARAKPQQRLDSD